MMNSSKTTKQLKKVEEILNVSQDTLESINVSIPEQSFEIEEASENKDLEVVDESIVELNDLKKSFTIAKRSLQQLVNYGQLLMSQSIGMELNDMKASEVAAIAQLSDTISRQLKMMLELFKDITEIEMNLKNIKQGSGNNYQVGRGGEMKVQNNYVFGGTTSDLIKKINENTK